MSEMFKVGQIRSFCEQQKGYHASEIIDFLHFCRFQSNYKAVYSHARGCVFVFVRVFKQR